MYTLFVCTYKHHVCMYNIVCKGLFSPSMGQDLLFQNSTISPVDYSDL